MAGRRGVVRQDRAAYETATVGLPDEVDVVGYFLSRRESDADSNQFLAAVVPQLADLRDVDPPRPRAGTSTSRLGAGRRSGRPAGRHLLLVVDGLDEDLLPPARRASPA